MPEGPEVEIVRRELMQLTSKRVQMIHLTNLSQNYAKYKEKQDTFSQYKEKMITEIIRHGKFLIWIFKDVEGVILNHLGMTGRWCLSLDCRDISSSISHPKVIIQMEKAPHAIFDDIRNFGQFKSYSSYEEVRKYPPIKSLGIDGLKNPFPLEEFLILLAKKQYQDKQIGEILLNQKLVAGVGNIYKAESLFHAEIHPLRKVKTLIKIEKERLGTAIGDILNKALEDGGSTFGRQPYIRPNGDQGEAQNWHGVYNRENKPCKTCGTPIQRILQMNRSTYFCPKCQQ